MVRVGVGWKMAIAWEKSVFCRHGKYTNVPNDRQLCECFRRLGDDVDETQVERIPSLAVDPRRRALSVFTQRL